ncbi:MAG TPA: hypothetical protein VE619_06925 [Nitrososphaeraceae archaeon]|nr:hypothetical protein [Nitrososphaeraceae archaeon]
MVITIPIRNHTSPRLLRRTKVTDRSGSTINQLPFLILHPFFDMDPGSPIVGIT